MGHVHASKGGRQGPLGRRVTTVLLAASVCATLTAPLASADTLADLRGNSQTNAQQQNAARNAVAESHQNVGAATQQLIESEAQLHNAHAVLADLTVQLQAAREKDARIAAELQAAREELERAKQRVAKAEADVEAQLVLIGQAARESFQQQTDLRGLTVVFASESPAELSQRLQWNTTIFDTQAAEKSRLDQVLAELEAARTAQAELEARIAAEKAESERNVAHIVDLERQAEQQRNSVAALVAANERARSAAQRELDADEANYRSLQAAEQDTQSLIQREIARIRAEEEAARARASSASRAATSSTSSGTSSSSAGQATSAWGFIRPVNAAYGSAFGQRFHPILNVWRAHNGVDMGAATGTPIHAAQSGTVLQAGVNGGFGQYTLISHGNLVNGRLTTTGYAHQSRIVVSPGQRVERGQLIGYVGNTGLSTSPHLHFEVRLDGSPVNPVHYVP